MASLSFPLPDSSWRLAGPFLSRPPSFSLSQPEAHRGDPASNAVNRTPPSSQPPTSSVCADIIRDLEELLEDEEEEEVVVPSSDSLMEDVDITLQPSPVKAIKRKRRQSMSDRDAREFLRFMSRNQLGIGAVLELFFPGPDSDSKAAIPGDDLLSSGSDLTDKTSYSHTMHFLRNGTTRWFNKVGAVSIARRYKAAPQPLLDLVLEMVKKESKNASRNEYLCGPPAGKTTISDLRDFDPEESAQLVRRDMPTVSTVLSAIAGVRDDEAEETEVTRVEDTEGAGDEPMGEQIDPPGRVQAVRILRRYGHRSRSAVVTSAVHSLLFARNQQCNRWPLQLGVDLAERAYLVAPRVFDSMAKDDHRRSLELLALPSTTFSISYDNVNWMRGIRDKRVEKKAVMMAAVAGMAYILNYPVRPRYTHLLRETL
ncbi:unnamed protein product [Tilletia controversa]|nr:unnamed protein product [Tilletia controversa]